MLELALQLSAIFTTWSKPEVYLHHTPYFYMEMLAIILELFSILYRCYYSQNYSGIIISGLVRIIDVFMKNRIVCSKHKGTNIEGGVVGPPVF